MSSEAFSMLARLNIVGNTHVEVAKWLIWQQLTPAAPLAPPQLLGDLYDFPLCLPNTDGQTAYSIFGSLFFFFFKPLINI